MTSTANSEDYESRLNHLVILADEIKWMTDEERKDERLIFNLWVDIKRYKWECRESYSSNTPVTEAVQQHAEGRCEDAIDDAEAYLEAFDLDREQDESDPH